ncbi:MAG: aminotransferase class V-fold PLP-dependent enzyme [Candidatus Eisenbacteria bacterium]|uniref:Aminotransferase class V-fold PLP-dependent enzyme n=1 Tax=Eiseniibacteriota bacterium TaxID=2212470 RepID=A0A538TJE1_UNCEI|nr:MAG: aminotransferase class V-fold PLP-dependent enzyme [Candidatus Eisenbacteria bacterium]
MTFGRAMLDQWLLDPDVIYLNHGTVGATPRRVLAKQQAIRDEIERRPSQFLLRELTGVAPVGMPRSEPPLLRAAAAEVAPFVGAKGEDFMFVENATTGVNAVLRSLDLREGDEVLITDHVYGAVAKIAAFVTRPRGARVRSIELPYPVPGPDAVVAAVLAAIGPRTRVLIVEHVTSESALVLPVREIASGCRAKGVRVLVDGAHAPGALPLDVSSLGVDWYSANLHKWAFTPRASGFLWVAPERREGLHPTVISWGLGQGLSAEFDLTGTRDPSPFLAAPEAIAFFRSLGVEAVRAYNHGLAWESARHLSRRWGTKLGMEEQMVGTMATVQLPDRMGSTPEDAARLRDALLFEDRIEIQLHAWRDRLWVRVSAQVYNDVRDIERLAAAVEAR